MRKKILKTLILSSIILLSSACLDKNNLEEKKITTTVYPVEYLISRLDPNNIDLIQSIYPSDTDVEKYELTDKQINDYSKSSSIFVYNGVTNEKEIAKTLINKNKKLQLLDVSYGLKYSYGVEELWLHPNNYLMLANTVKEDLEELSSNKYTIEDIESNYNDLEEELALLDADLRILGSSAKSQNKNTLVIGYNTFGFLQDYGFNIVDISEENNITTSIKNKFKDKTYKYVLVRDSKTVPDYIKDLVDNYGVTLVYINTMETLTEKERENQENYLSIMHDFINQLSNIVLN